MTNAYTLLQNGVDETHTQKRLDALAVLVGDHLNRNASHPALRNTTGLLGTESGEWKWSPHHADPMQATCEMVARRCRKLLPAGYIEHLHCSRVSNASEIIELTIVLKIIAHAKIEKKRVCYLVDPLHWHFQLQCKP
jgi:hypothetical protein